jgi:hypothetical protein
MRDSVTCIIASRYAAQLPCELGQPCHCYGLKRACRSFEPGLRRLGRTRRSQAPAVRLRCLCARAPSGGASPRQCGPSAPQCAPGFGREPFSRLSSSLASRRGVSTRLRRCGPLRREAKAWREVARPRATARAGARAEARQAAVTEAGQAARPMARALAAAEPVQAGWGGRAPTARRWVATGGLGTEGACPLCGCACLTRHVCRHVGPGRVARWRTSLAVVGEAHHCSSRGARCVPRRACRIADPLHDCGPSHQPCVCAWRAPPRRSAKSLLSSRRALAAPPGKPLAPSTVSAQAGPGSKGPRGAESCAGSAVCIGLAHASLNLQLLTPPR